MKLTFPDKNVINTNCYDLIQSPLFHIFFSVNIPFHLSLPSNFVYKINPKFLEPWHCL